jgi:hypothetical protein
VPAAPLLHEGRPALFGHRLLAVVYAALLVVALLALAGVVDEALGWKWRVVRESLQPAIARATIEHLAALAWSLAVVPFLVGAAAALDVLFAGGEVRGRYLVYAVPLVVVALASALAPLRRPAWSLLAAVLTWLGLGLSRITGRVNDWFVMTDELLYERLAISVARTGSPLPHVRGEPIESFSQLYPLLIAPAYAGSSRTRCTTPT